MKKKAGSWRSALFFLALLGLDVVRHGSTGDAAGTDAHTSARTLRRGEDAFPHDASFLRFKSLFRYKKNKGNRFGLKYQYKVLIENAI